MNDPEQVFIRKRKKQFPLYRKRDRNTETFWAYCRSRNGIGIFCKRIKNLFFQPPCHWVSVLTYDAIIVLKTGVLKTIFFVRIRANFLQWDPGIGIFKNTVNGIGTGLCTQAGTRNGIPIISVKWIGIGISGRPSIPNMDE